MNSNLYRLVFDPRRGMRVAVAENVSAPRRAGEGARRGGRARAALGVFLLTATAAAVAQALPDGATVVRGAGSVKVDGSAMVVRQDTARMVTDWQSFSIGAGASVQFVQPSSQAVALNRVIGADPSAILGRLSANGHVYLQNPNGVLFAPGAQVDVGSLVATTLSADLNAFMAGRLDLSAGDAPAGAVVNEGELRAAPGGYVLLAGPQVANHGRIEAPRGTIGLAAANAVTVDATGAGLLDIQVPVAAIGAQLSHSGQSLADGGRISLQVAAADAARRTVMQVDGLLRAQRIEQRGGQIVLSGGEHGVVKVSGTLDASAPAGIGGEISVLGERVGLLGTATLDVSGAAGGGQLLAGGNFQGRGPEANAQVTVVGRDVTLDASATQQGDGGRVIVWSDGHTRFEGQIHATGGAQGGDGGFAEVSGMQTLDFLGGVDLRAPQGQQGLLLLDPDIIYIDNVADVNGDLTQGDDLIDNLAVGDFPGATSEITAARVRGLLFGADVSLQAGSGIYVFSPIEVAPGGALSTLTLEASIVEIDATMTLNNSSLVIRGNFPGSDSVLVAADVQSLRSVSISATDITLDNTTLSADQVTLRSTQDGAGQVFQHNDHVIQANSVIAGEAGARFGSVSLYGDFNQIRALSLNVVGSAYLVNDNNGYAVDVSGSAGALYVATVSGITQSAPLTTGFLALITTDPGATGAVVLTDPGNVIDGIGFDVAGSINVFTTGSLFNDADYVTDAGGDVCLEALGTFTLNRNVTSATLVEVYSAGFINGGAAQLIAPRFTIWSSDYTLDDFGAITFGQGAAQINSVVFNGYTGSVVPADNTLYTNQDGRLLFDPADIPGLSRVYDGTTAVTVGYGLGPTSADAFAVTIDGDVPLLGLQLYGVTLAGNFDDANAGVDKGFTLASSTDTFALGGSVDVPGSSVAYYGLRTDPVVRAPGPSATIPVSEITPLALAVAGVTAANKVYDTTTAASLVGVPTVASIVGDDVAVGGVVLAEFDDKNVGTGKPVTVAGYTLGGADAPNYTLLQPAGLTADITPAPLFVDGLSALDKVYDTTTVAGLVGVAAVTPLPGDVVTIGGVGVGAFADKNVGLAKPVGVSGYVLGGADGGNYTPVAPAGLTADITPALLFVDGLTALDKVYDATLDATLAGIGTVSPLGSDSVALSGTPTGTFSDKNVGLDIPVAVAGVALVGPDAGNYLLIAGSDLAADITPRVIVPTGIVAADRRVDGSVDVAIDTSAATLAGVLPGDAVALLPDGASGVVDSPDPGVDKPVTILGLALDGPDAMNYILSADPVATGTTVSFLALRTPLEDLFEELRFAEYLQGVSDAQEPFRRAMAEALAAGFGKENIRKRLSLGLVFETGLAAPAIEDIQPAGKPPPCDAGGSGGALTCR